MNDEERNELIASYEVQIILKHEEWERIQQMAYEKLREVKRLLREIEDLKKEQEVK